MPVLMSALEFECVDHRIRDAHPIDKALKTLVVYGGYIPCRVDRRRAVMDMRAAKGKTVGLVWADLCRWASLVDIETYPPEDVSGEIPFAALVRTTEWMPGLMGSALAYFPIFCWPLFDVQRWSRRCWSLSICFRSRS